MWNFAGRQNDAQGHGNVRDGNWLSGLDFIDQQRLGERSMITDEMKANKGWNRFYFLPLILGILGLVFQFVRDPKGGSVVGFLFLLTGIAIVVYLNQTPLQPRERDYAYAGSFYAFAVWIGLGVMALYEASRVQMTKSRFMALGIPLGIGLFLYVLESITGEAHAISMAVLFMSHCGRIALRAFVVGEQIDQIQHAKSSCVDWPRSRSAHSDGIGRLERSRSFQQKNQGSRWPGII